MKKFRRLSLEGVADKLEDPSDEKQTQRVPPQPVEEDAGDKNWDREQDGRDAQRVTHPVHRMLMTSPVLRDPLFIRAMFIRAMLVAASAQHVGDDITKEKRLTDFSCQPFALIGS